jgi:hypothetical protein
MSRHDFCATRSALGKAANGRASDTGSHLYRASTTSDGRVDQNVTQHALNPVATELGAAAASVDQVYQPAP